MDDFTSAVGVDPLWEELRLCMDFNHDNIITQNEFLEGFVAVALLESVSCERFGDLANKATNLGDNFKLLTAVLNEVVDSKVAALERSMQAKGVPGWGGSVAESDHSDV